MSTVKGPLIKLTVIYDETRILSMSVSVRGYRTLSDCNLGFPPPGLDPKPLNPKPRNNSGMLYVTPRSGKHHNLIRI